MVAGLWTEVARRLAEHYGMPDTTTEYGRLVAAADRLVRARRLLGDDAGGLIAPAS
ncbi:hypothetical protein [Nocardia sp. BMG51109]|uniref:hypothetical protein n=1 Tax=Nocardia sp. BMG51109 TaxID=1056816 RepID=UPI0004AED6E3|nr:hypothetical protein [Nocardia sp. BMG51109]